MTDRIEITKKQNESLTAQINQLQEEIEEGKNGRELTVNISIFRNKENNWMNNSLIWEQEKNTFKPKSRNILDSTLKDTNKYVHLRIFSETK